MKKLVNLLCNRYKNFFSILLLTLTLNAYAQAHEGIGMPAANAIVQAIKELQFYITSAVNAAFATSNKLLFESNPSLPTTILANTQLPTATSSNKNTIKAFNKYFIPSTLNNRNEDEITRLSFNIPASDIPNEFEKDYKAEQIENGNNMLNIESLLGTNVYPNFVAFNLRQDPAYNFIQLAGNIYDPITTLSLRNLNPKIKNPDDLTKIRESLDYQKLQAAVRAYVAAQSVGAMNLYQMMVERIPRKDLGANAGMTDSNGNPIVDASPLQLQEFLAKRRSENKNWYQQMNVASPATVQRETLFVLAEIRQQLFEMQQQNERLLATLSVMEMQQNYQISKLGILQAEKTMEDTVRKAQGLPPKISPKGPGGAQIP